MAHYIASLMNAAEVATGEQALELRAQCSTEILKLWKHRAGLPGEDRPMSSFDPIIRALENLDPERPAWKRLRGFSNRKELEGPTGQLLNAAIAIDESSVRATRALLREAAILAGDRERTWVSAAADVEGEDTLTNFFDGLALALDDGDTPKDERTVSLNNSIRSLEDAIIAAEAALRTLKARLESSPPPS